MKTSIKVIAMVAGLVLSVGAMACPADKFHRQNGDFDWMVSGNFNGKTFEYKGTSYAELREMFEKYFKKSGMLVPTSTVR